MEKGIFDQEKNPLGTMLSAFYDSEAAYDEKGDYCGETDFVIPID